jgi:hypothetical protein
VETISAEGGMTVGDLSAKEMERWRKKVAEELWLNYFNRFLFEKGLITESERNRMTTLIANRSSAATERRSNKHDRNDKKEIGL